MADNLDDIALLSRTVSAAETKHATSASLPADDPLEQLSRTLFARITECVINHETEDWPGYYDKLCATVCQVVARSDLGGEAKSLLTRRLIEHVVELQRWWPRLTRTMKKITEIAGAVGTKLRDRSRSVKFRLFEIARIARAKGPLNRDRLQQRYRRLLDTTSRVVGQAKRFSKEISERVKWSADVVQQIALEGLREELDRMLPLVRRVMHQTRARIVHGDTHVEGKILSVFEPSTEVIRKGKAGKPNEFGKMIKLQEAENQIIVDYEVYARRPNDSDLLIPAIAAHQAKLGRVPRLVATDAGFYSARNEAAAKAMGVKRVCIPNRSSRSPERKREQKKRWFRNGQKWRTGCEGRISVVKRRNGLDRCRYRSDDGMQRWVGLGVISDNLLNIGRVMSARAAP